MIPYQTNVSLSWHPVAHFWPTSLLHFADFSCIHFLELYPFIPSHLLNRYLIRIQNSIRHNPCPVLLPFSSKKYTQWNDWGLEDYDGKIGHWYNLILCLTLGLFWLIRDIWCLRGHDITLKAILPNTGWISNMWTYYLIAISPPRHKALLSDRLTQGPGFHICHPDFRHSVLPSGSPWGLLLISGVYPRQCLPNSEMVIC